MSSAGGSFSHLSLHLGSDFMVRCSAYDDQTPILTIDAGNASVSITPSGTDANDNALKFGRELARKAQEFAAEIERMHAEPGNPDGNTKADAGKAA
jgi:hypothetical protein